MVVGAIRRFRWRKARVLLAFFAVWWMWGDQEQCLCRETPRYLAVSPFSSMWPWMEYSASTGDLFLVIRVAMLLVTCRVFPPVSRRSHYGVELWLLLFPEASFCCCVGSSSTVLWSIPTMMSYPCLWYSLRQRGLYLGYIVWAPLCYVFVFSKHCSLSRNCSVCGVNCYGVHHEQYTQWRDVECPQIPCCKADKLGRRQSHWIWHGSIEEYMSRWVICILCVLCWCLSCGTERVTRLGEVIRPPTKELVRRTVWTSWQHPQLAFVPSIVGWKNAQWHAIFLERMCYPRIVSVVMGCHIS